MKRIILLITVLLVIGCKSNKSVEGYIVDKISYIYPNGSVNYDVYISNKNGVYEREVDSVTFNSCWRGQNVIYSNGRIISL